MKIKVLIADDHPVTRAGVRSILEDDSNIEIVGEAKDGREAVNLVDAKKPEVVMMDITMPQLSGIDATKEIISKYPNMKVIALSIHTGQKFVKEMIDAGASGYLLKDEMPEELIKAISAVVKGEMYLSTGVTKVALEKNSSKNESIDKRVFQSKLLRPPLMPDFVIRSKIIHKLEQNVLKPLSMVSAGAGYGKSVVVSQWLEQTNYLKTWITLDLEHNDLRTFLNYLVVSIQKLFPGQLQLTQSYVSATVLPPIQEIAKTIINELCMIQEYFILVLDDYHMITESMVHELIDEWLQFPPTNVHLCIITRRDPPLKINSLKLNGRMTEVRTKDLSFSSAEITDLFKRVQLMDLKDDVIKIIHNKTEGWIVALRLVSMILNDEEELGHRLKSIEGGLKSTYEYLMIEVFSKQPEQFQDHLLKSSILHRFCFELIEAVTNGNADVLRNKDGVNLIQDLNKDNLFIIPLDIDRKWFRYHHLFQEFLQYQLKERKTEDQVSDLYLRASLWFEKQGLITEAVEYASEAKDTEHIISIISENWEDAFDEDHWDSVDRWLSLLPEELIDQSKDLLFARLWIFHRSHRLKQIGMIINQIEQMDVSLTDKERGYLVFAKCMVGYFSGAPADNVLTLAKQATQLIPKKYSSFRGSIPIYSFFSLQSTGQIDQALQFIEDNIKNHKRSDAPVQLMRYRIHLGYFALFNGDLPLLKSAVELCFKMPRMTPWIQGHARYLKQSIGWWEYDPKQVIEATDYTLAVKYELAYREVIDTCICRAIAFQELNRYAESEKVIRETIEYIDHVNESSDLNLIHSCQARLNIAQGNLGAATKWLNETESSSLNPAMLFWVEVPAITRCRVLIAKGTPKDLQQALELLSQYSAYSESVFNKLRTIEIIVLQAVALKKLKKQQEAISTLKDAIELVGSGEWIRPFAEYKDEISDMLLHLKKTGVNPGFIDQIFIAVAKIRSVDAKTNTVTTKENNKDIPTAFTRRELEVLRCVAEGLRNQEIAEKLFNSEETIKKHINNMFQKMHVKNRLSLVTKAREEGILK